MRHDNKNILKIIRLNIENIRVKNRFDEIEHCFIFYWFVFFFVFFSFKSLFLLDFIDNELNYLDLKQNLRSCVKYSKKINELNFDQIIKFHPQID